MLVSIIVLKRNINITMKRNVKKKDIFEVISKRERVYEPGIELREGNGIYHQTDKNRFLLISLLLATINFLQNSMTLWVK